MTEHTPFYRQNIVEIINQTVWGMIEKHSKVLPVRVDIRFPQGHAQDGGNWEIQKLMKNIVQHYRNHLIECRYVVVREQNLSDAPHYHVNWPPFRPDTLGIDRRLGDIP